MFDQAAQHQAAARERDRVHHGRLDEADALEARRDVDRVVGRQRAERAVIPAEDEVVVAPARPSARRCTGVRGRERAEASDSGAEGAVHQQQHASPAGRRAAQSSASSASVAPGRGSGLRDVHESLADVALEQPRRAAQHAVSPRSGTHRR